MNTKRKIAILGSGIALGVYIPALRLKDYLKKLGYEVSAYILEELFPTHVQEKLIYNKQVFHKDFRIAKKAHQLPGNMSKNCAADLVDELFQAWQKEGIERFVVFSGYWIEILQQYEKIFGKSLIIDCFHMDSEISNSWKNHLFQRNMNQIWAFNHKDGRVKTYIPYNTGGNSLNNSKNRVLIHGGGWGMFSYNCQSEALGKFEVYRVAYNKEEYFDFLQKHKRAYYMKEDWKPWKRSNDGELTYPSIYKEGDHISSLNEMLHDCDAIISKPGGGTLMDSISLGKPLIFLAPLGNYEKMNQELWEKLGFGISFEKWEDTNFSDNIIYEMKLNLKREKDNIFSAEEYLCSLKRV